MLEVSLKVTYPKCYSASCTTTACSKRCQTLVKRLVISGNDLSPNYSSYPVQLSYKIIPWIEIKPISLYIGLGSTPCAHQYRSHPFCTWHFPYLVIVYLIKIIHTAYVIYVITISVSFNIIWEDINYFIFH